jgi:drug/metabolite transporter (DMT)-like permease
MDAESSRLRFKTRVFAIIVVLSGALGNFFLSLGMRRYEGELSLSPVNYIAAIFTPFVALGVSLLIIWLLTRMALLGFADLSYVLPVTSIGYVASAILGRMFLNEQISVRRWAGTLLVVAGTIMVGLTREKTVGAGR